LKAVILAGGFGTRLRPISYLYPKPMVPIRGKPFLEYLLDSLKVQGVSEFILCLHYMADRFIEYFGDGSKFGYGKIIYSIEEKPMGTAGAIKKVESYLDSTFLVLNGDTYLDVDIRRMLSFHQNNENLGTIALVRMKNVSRYGLVDVSPNWRVIGFFEKVQSSEGYINAGVYIFEKRILDYILADRRVSLEKEVLPSILGRERIFGFPVDGYFIDIGVPEDYYRLQKDLAKVFRYDN
jgi:NDP-sugar pyrophosphorylase family protein